MSRTLITLWLEWPQQKGVGIEINLTRDRLSEIGIGHGCPAESISFSDFLDARKVGWLRLFAMKNIPEKLLRGEIKF